MKDRFSPLKSMGIWETGNDRRWLEEHRNEIYSEKPLSELPPQISIEEARERVLGISDESNSQKATLCDPGQNRTAI